MRLQHVVTRERISVDPEKWAALFDTEPTELRESVRAYVVQLVLESPAARDGAIVSARRDRL